MQNKIAAAVFNECERAEKAIHELRDAGVPDKSISLIQLHDDETETKDGSGRTVEAHEGDDKGSGTAKGLATGGALGAIAGLGALFIPGVGPFIAAGALAETLGVAGSAAVASGVVGAAAGGLTGALLDYGMDREQAEYYERRVREGGVLVTVDTSENPSAYQPTRGILRAAGGEMAEGDNEHESSRERTHDHA